jgi:hypothetical protein
VQSFQPQLPVALAPSTAGYVSQVHAHSNGRVVFASSAVHHDLCALYDRMRQPD